MKGSKKGDPVCQRLPLPPLTRKSTRFTGYRNSRFTSGPWARLDPVPVHSRARARDILSNLIKLPRVSGFPWFLGGRGRMSMKVGVVEFAKLRELNLRFSRRTSGAKFDHRENEPVSFDAGKILTLEEGRGYDSIIDWLMERDYFREGIFF